MNDMQPIIPAWPVGNGEMAGLIHAHDWSATPLGPIEGWSERLKAAVDLMLAAPQPVYVAWGPENVSLYNDAYVPILGDKHPGGLGRPYQDLWREIWDDYRPLIEATMAGEAHLVRRPAGAPSRAARPADKLVLLLLDAAARRGRQGGRLLLCCD